MTHLSLPVDWSITHNAAGHTVRIDGQVVMVCRSRFDAECGLVEYVIDLIDQGLLPSQLELDEVAASIVEAR